MEPLLLVKLLPLKMVLVKLLSTILLRPLPATLAETLARSRTVFVVSVAKAGTAVWTVWVGSPIVSSPSTVGWRGRACPAQNGPQWKHP